jgi:hypothetical protein
VSDASAVTRTSGSFESHRVPSLSHTEISNRVFRPIHVDSSPSPSTEHLLASTTDIVVDLFVSFFCVFNFELSMPPKRWRTKNRGGASGSGGNNDNNTNSNNEVPPSSPTVSNASSAASSPIQVLQRNPSTTPSSSSSPNKPTNVSSPLKTPLSTVWSTPLVATAAAASAAAATTTPSSSTTPSSAIANVSNSSSSVATVASPAATTPQPLQLSQAAFLRSLSNVPQSPFLPLEQSAPPADAVTAVNVAFDVFLTEAQVRHATVLMRQKLVECTALRIREAAADARAAAESALHDE